MPETKAPTLQDLTEAQLTINKILELSLGEIDDTLETIIDKVEVQTPDKLQKYFNRIKYAKLCIQWFKENEDTARSSRKTLERFINWATGNIKWHMQALGLKEANAVTVRYTLASCRPSLVIDEALLPEEWKMSVTTWVPDRQRIEDAVLSGVEIPGAKLEGGFSLRSYSKKP